MPKNLLSLYYKNTTMPNKHIEFEKLLENNFFMLDGITYCKFGRYGIGFNDGEKTFKIVDPKTLVEQLELKDVLNRKTS